MKNAIWTDKGEWSSVWITKSKKGFIVNTRVSISGNRSGKKVLYYFDQDFGPETDLSEPWNDFYSYGDILCDRALRGTGPCTIKNLCNGWLVQ